MGHSGLLHRNISWCRWWRDRCEGVDEWASRQHHCRRWHHCIAWQLVQSEQRQLRSASWRVSNEAWVWRKLRHRCRQLIASTLLNGNSSASRLKVCQIRLWKLYKLICIHFLEWSFTINEDNECLPVCDEQMKGYENRELINFMNCSMVQIFDIPDALGCFGWRSPRDKFVNNVSRAWNNNFHGLRMSFND